MGRDRQWLEAELERVDTGNDHCAYPILRPYPLPERMRLYIRAIVRSRSGQSFFGYIMNNDAYALCIVVNGDEFFFSRNHILRDLNRQSLKRMAATIGCSPTDLFPVSYETDFLDSEDKPIEGVFSLTEQSS